MRDNEATDLAAQPEAQKMKDGDLKIELAMRDSEVKDLAAKFVTYVWRVTDLETKLARREYTLKQLRSKRRRPIPGPEGWLRSRRAIKASLLYLPLRGKKTLDRLRSGLERRWPALGDWNHENSTPQLARPRAAPITQYTRLREFDYKLERKWISVIQAQTRPHERPPLISIILPTKDRRALLPLAISSVIHQTYSNWELIIIDDGSTDGSCDMIRRQYQDDRLKLVQIPSSGVSVARNVGLETAQGEVIAYLDSDDIWTSRFLELVVLEMKRAGASTIYAAAKYLTSMKSRPYYRSRPFSYQELTISNFIAMCIFAHKRDVYQELGGFDESLRRMVDWDLILRYTKKYEPTFAPFIGAIVDSSSNSTRITTSESIHYKYIIQNRFMSDTTIQQVYGVNGRSEIAALSSGRSDNNQKLQGDTSQLRERGGETPPNGA